MPAKAKLSDAQVNKIRRRVQAGASRTELAAEYRVNRKTIWRRLRPLELAEGERGRQGDVGAKPAPASERADAGSRQPLVPVRSAPTAPGGSLRRPRAAPGSVVSVQARARPGSTSAMRVSPLRRIRVSTW